MELLIFACLSFSCVSLASWWRFRPAGWVAAWAYLFAIAAIGRALLVFPPPFAPRAIQGVIFVSSILILANLLSARGRRARGPTRLEPGRILPACFFALFLVFLHFHPVYDIDSLSYHIPAIQWLYERPGLPPSLSLFENHHVHFRMIGVEEFLAVGGLNGNLPFFMALLQALFKALGFFSLVSLLPAGFWLGSSLLLLFLCDQYFLYSGVNRMIHFSPSFVVLWAMAVFFCWRAWRGHRESFWLALCLVLALPAVKYHGAILFPVLSAFLVLSFLRKTSLFHLPVGVASRRLVLFFLGTALVTDFEIYGLNWLETGTPLYPADFGPFHLSRPNRLVEALHWVFPQGSFWRSFLSPYETIYVLPNNLAMRIGFYLMLPAFVLFLLARSRRDVLSKSWYRLRCSMKSKYGISGGGPRELGFLALALSCTWLWAAFAQFLVAKEIRFPSLVFGLTSIGLLQACFHWRPRSLYFLYGRSVFSLLLAVAACGYVLFASNRTEPRIYAHERPSWKMLGKFIRAGGPPALSIENPAYSGIFEDWTNRNIPQVGACLRAQGLAEKDLIVIAPFPWWPGYLAGSLSPRADPFADFSPEAIPYFGYALVPRKYLKNTPEAFGRLAPGAERILDAARRSTPLCGSSEMVLVRI